MNKSILLPALVATITVNSFGDRISFSGTYSFVGGDGQASYTLNKEDPDGRGYWYDSRGEVTGYAPDGERPLGVTVSAGSGSVLAYDRETWEDGFGVKDDDLSSTPGNGTEDGEIDGAERLSISFSQEIFVQSFDLTDLFFETTSTGSAYSEVGYYKVNDGSWVAFSADNSAVAGTNGEKLLEVNANVTSLIFKASENTDGMFHDFSVRAFTYQAAAPVPEPSTLALFGLAMLSVVGYRRIRKN